MAALQFDPVVGALLRIVEALVRVGAAVGALAVVFALARATVPRVVRRLGLTYGWSANGESVLTAVGIGTTATLGAAAVLRWVGFGGLVGAALLVGGVATGVGVERRRIRTVSPVLEALGLLAALLAVGVAALAVGGPARPLGAFLAAAALGGLGHAGVRTVTRSPGNSAGTAGTASTATDGSGAADGSGPAGTSRDRRR